MDSNTKTLVIINGVTGAIGTATLASFSRKEAVTIYGLSRQGQAIDALREDEYLPDSSLICSIGNDISSRDACERFVSSINQSLYSKIIYVHAVGLYPFEIDKMGELKVTHDYDGDGIDDRVMSLSFEAFFSMTTALDTFGVEVKALVFGGIADKHKPEVHHSWWKVMELVKKRIKNEKKRNIKYCVLNISSVICPHEILTRPFVFSKTNADPKYWLKPSEVSDKVLEITETQTEAYKEIDLFRPASYYSDDYFSEDKFTSRKRLELGI